jgi:hypothetical protein
MKSSLIVLAGLALCGVGAVGFFKDLDLWGAWVIVGALVISTQVD